MAVARHIDEPRYFDSTALPATLGLADLRVCCVAMFSSKGASLADCPSLRNVVGL
jgi:hypothetical protein